jgi:DNA-binding transcriptional regulator YhcF (GntR family)
MAHRVRLTLTESQQKLLEKWGRGGSTPYRQVIRAQIILLAARQCSDRQIALQLHVNPITVARWRSRFQLLGVEGIRHEAPRLGSPPPVSRALVRTILRKTLLVPPPHRGPWSTRSLAREVGVSHSTIRRVWGAYDVRPARTRLATLARDSRFRPKSIDVVGVYVNPPQRVVALSVRSLEPTRGGRGEGTTPPTNTRPVPRRRSWIGELVTTLALLEDRELKGSAHRLVDPEFLSFLHSVRRQRRGKERIELLGGAAAAPPPTSLSRWLLRHPEFSAHTRTGDPPLRELVVEWFGDRSQGAPVDTPPASLPGLRTAVEHWARQRDNERRPFAWTRR